MAMQQVKASTEYHSETVITPYSYTGTRRLVTVTTAFVILQSLCHDNISKCSLTISLHNLPNSLFIITACLDAVNLCHYVEQERKKKKSEGYQEWWLATTVRGDAYLFTLWLYTATQMHTDTYTQGSGNDIHYSVMIQMLAKLSTLTRCSRNSTNLSELFKNKWMKSSGFARST